MVGPTKELSFGEALRRLKNGERICRAGWNGKGMWLKLVDPVFQAVGVYGSPVLVGAATFEHDIDSSYPLLPWIGMKTADDKFVPWLASQTDVLAEDWELAP